MFFEEFIEFKNKLQQQNSTNLKYLICRLDFNEYYLKKQFAEEEEAEERKGDFNLDNYDESEEDQDDDIS